MAPPVHCTSGVWSGAGGPETRVHEGSGSGSPRPGEGSGIHLASLTATGAMGSMFSRVTRALNQRLRSQTWTVAVSTVPQAALMALSAPRN